MGFVGGTLSAETVAAANFRFTLPSAPVLVVLKALFRQCVRDVTPTPICTQLSDTIALYLTIVIHTLLSHTQAPVLLWFCVSVLYTPCPVYE